MNINEIKADLFNQLHGLIAGTGGLVATFLNYPTLATNEPSPLAMLATMAITPENAVTGGDGASVDFALVVAIRCEKGKPNTWDAAEGTLNEIETRIIGGLWAMNSRLWRSVAYRQPSQRPPSPPEFLQWRWAEIYLRVYL